MTGTEEINEDSFDLGKDVVLVVKEIKFDFSDVDFEKLINERITDAKEVLELTDVLIPSLTVVSEDSINTFLFPTTTALLSPVSKYVKKTFKQVKGLIFIMESWALKITDKNVLKRYMKNPSLVGNHPMKDETLVIYVFGFDNKYLYHLDFYRDDNGNIVWDKLSEFKEGKFLDEVVPVLASMIE